MAEVDVKAVLTALDSDNAAQTTLHQMLAAGLPHAVGAAPAERHGYQQEHLEMTRDALEAAQKDGEAAKVGTKRKLEEAQEGLTGREAKITTVETSIKEAEEAAKGKEKVLHSKREEVGSVKKLKHAADGEFNSLKKTAGAAQKASDEVAQVKELLGVLREGGWADDEFRDTSADEVKKLLESLEVEDCLMTAAPLALRRPPAERGAFDKVVLTGVSDAVTKKSEAVEKEAAGATQTMEEAQWEAMGLAALLEVSQDSRDDADREHRDAVSTLKQANTELKHARNDVSKQQDSIVSLEIEINAADDRAKVRQEALEALQRLKEWAYATEKTEVAEETAAASKVEAAASTSAAESGTAAACGA